MILTFYSFKGGVGRSMAMATVAYLMAQRGLRVLTIDFDLEAPGLERYFFDEQSRLDKARGDPGLIDLVLAYKRALTSETEFARAEFKRWTKYVSEPIARTPSGGVVHLMTSGCRYPHERYVAYAQSVRTFDWQDFFHNWRGDRFFDWLRRELTTGSNAYDVVFVDSRTGVTEMGGVCAYQLADVVVLLCAPNHQNLEGTRAVVNDFQSEPVIALRRGRPLEVVVLPARVEQSDPIKRDRFFEEFEQTFGTDGLPKLLAEAGLNYRKLAVPYERELAITETRVDDTSVGWNALSSDSVARASFEVIADAVTLLGTGERWETLKRDAFARLKGETRTLDPLPIADLSRRGARYDVFIEAGAGDRRHAESLRRALDVRGLHVWTGEDLPADENWDSAVGLALEYSEALVVVVGSSPPSELLRRTLHSAQNRRKPIVPVLLPGCRDWQIALEKRGLAEYESVDLRGGMDDSAAIGRLVEALRRRPAADSPLALGIGEPYVGATPFSEDQASYFFGRDSMAEQAVAALSEHCVVLLSGPAGSGKTSFLNAKTLPRIRAGHLHAGKIGERVWEVEVVDFKQATAARKLEDIATAQFDRPLLVAVDSIDSFTEDGSERARRDRVNLVAQAVSSAGSLRRFFLIWRGTWSNSERDGARNAWIGQRPGVHELVLEALDENSLRLSIERPAAKAGHIFEPGLVDRIVQDAGTQPGAISQIQRTLIHLWVSRRSGWLTNRAYDADDGIGGRYNRRLETFLNAQAADVRKAVETMLRSLVQFDAQLRAVPLAQPWESLATMPKVLRHDPIVLRERLLQEGLIDLWASPDGQVLCGLSHRVPGPLIEGLARIDPRFVLWRQRFQTYVYGFVRQGRPDAYDMPADASSEADLWWNSHNEELSGDETRLVQSSRRAREDAERQRKAAQRELEEWRGVLTPNQIGAWEKGITPLEEFWVYLPRFLAGAVEEVAAPIVDVMAHNVAIKDTAYLYIVEDKNDVQRLFFLVERLKRHPQCLNKNIAVKVRVLILGSRANEEVNGVARAISHLLHLGNCWIANPQDDALRQGYEVAWDEIGENEIGGRKLPAAKMKRIVENVTEIINEFPPPDFERVSSVSEVESLVNLSPSIVVRRRSGVTGDTAAQDGARSNTERSSVTLRR